MMDPAPHLPHREAARRLDRILVVDDQPSNLLSLRAVLGGGDYDLVEAGSGAEAVHCVKDGEFAVILLDVQMPGMDGFETARRIRGLNGARATPIIFLTAIHPSESYALQGYEAGAVDYLFKPLDPGILRAKVDSFVRLHRAKADLSALREALQTRDEFLSIASHELRTPITPLQLQLQGFLRMIEAGKLKTVPVDQLRDMLEMSDAQVSRLARLIEQLLDVSRLDEGRLLLEYDEHDLTLIVRETLEQAKHQIDAAQCNLRLELDENIRGIWDRLRLEQVLMNLLLNSIKYAAGGDITIRTSRRGEKAVLSVSDNGIGIAPGDQARIFERFERAVPVRNFGGLGLGLYVSREIVLLHGGTISVRSELGCGATFEVELPLAPPSLPLN